MSWRPDLSIVESIVSFQSASRKRGGFAFFLKNAAKLRHRFWSIVTASDINRNAEISPDLKLPHPNGVVIHQDVRIGSNCMIMQQVTIGQLADGQAPVIGSGVYIGAGAKILGGISVGDNARIGANSVVLCDVPENCTAVGIPARLITKS